MTEIFKLTPSAQFFLVRIPKNQQKERLEKIGSIYIPPDYVFLTRGMQCGEIIAIGEGAKQYFPEAQIGHILLFHHIVEGKKDHNGNYSFYIGADDEYTYYIVTAYSDNGEKNLSYGVWDGEKIIPNKDYIFLKTHQEKETDIPELELESCLAGEGSFKPDIAMTFSAGGLIIPKERKKSRHELTEQMNKNTIRIKQISRISRMRPEVVEEIQNLEAENNRISKEINKRTYEFHTIAAINQEFNIQIERSFNHKVNAGDKVAMLNIACYTEVEFLKQTYIVAETQYFGCTERWAKNIF